MAVTNSAGSVGTEVTKGVIVGGLATAAVVVLAPVALPLIGLGAAAGVLTGMLGIAPWAGAAVGGYLGYKKATSQ